MTDKVGLEAILEVSQFSAGLRVYLSGIDRANRETVKTAAATASATTKMGGWWGDVGKIVAGIGIADFLRSAGAQLDGYVRGAIGAKSAAQGLEVQMRGLIAASLRSADATLSVSDSFEKAIPLTKELTGWIRQTALETPFTSETLARLVAMNLGMGVSAGTAKVLAIAAGNMAAGLSLGDEGAISITRALNQMINKGKVSAEELNQIREAGGQVGPVFDILAKKFNVTAQEAQAMASSGAISANDFATAFVEAANTQFPNAMENMSRTLEGVQSSWEDFYKNIIGIDALGPVIDKFTEDAYNAVSRLSQPDVSGFAQAIGEMLSAGYDQVKDFASSMFGAGQNMIIELANGLIAGAAAVIDALADIGGVISYWLAPGSPPRILPDLPKWGADAFGEYMNGWGKGDTSVFNDISKSVEGFIRSIPMPGDDKSGKVSLIDRIFGSRSAVAGAIDEMRNFGDVSEGSLSRILDAAGIANPQMKDYLRTLFQLQGANSKVAIAQDELTKAQKAYDDALKAADAKIDAVTDAEKSLADQVKISQLQMVMNDPGATALEKERARLQIEKIRAEQAKRNVMAEKKGAVEAAKVKVDAAELEQSRLAAQADAQRGVLDIQQQQNSLLGEQLKLLESIAAQSERAAKSASGGGQTKRAGKLDLGDTGGGKDEGEAENAKKAWMDKINELFAPITTKLAELKTNWDGAFAGLTTVLEPVGLALDQLGGKWTTFVNDIGSQGGYAKQIVADMVTFVFTQLGIVLPQVFANIGMILEKAGELWREHGDTVMEVVNFAWRFIITFIGGVMLWISGLIAAGMQVISGDWSGAWETIKNTASTFFESVLGIVGMKTEEFKTIWKNVGQQVSTMWNSLWQDIPKTLVSGFAGVFVVLQPALTRFLLKFDEMFAKIKEFFVKFVDTIKTNIATWFEKAKTFIAEIEWFKLGEDIVKGIANGLIGAAGWLYQAVGDMIRNALTSGQDEMDAHSPSRKAADMLGEPIPEGAAAGIWRKIDLVRDASLAMVNSALRPAQSAGSYSYSYSNVNNFNLSVATRASDQSVVSHFNTMRAMAGMP